MSNSRGRRGESSPWGDPLPPARGRVSANGLDGLYRAEPVGVAGNRWDDPDDPDDPWGADDFLDRDSSRGAAVGTAAGSRPLRRRREPGRLFRATRASLALLVISLGLGLALASAFGLLFWALASAVHHAST